MSSLSSSPLKDHKLRSTVQLENALIRPCLWKTISQQQNFPKFNQGYVKRIYLPSKIWNSLSKCHFILVYMIISISLQSFFKWRWNKQIPIKCIEGDIFSVLHRVKNIYGFGSSLLRTSLHQVARIAYVFAGKIVVF